MCLARLLLSISCSSTVEQEIFVTGNFRDFQPQAIRVQEIFANPGVEDLPSFKISPCLLNLDNSGNIHEQEFFANLPIFAKLHMKICCSTVLHPNSFKLMKFLIGLS